MAERPPIEKCSHIQRRRDTHRHLWQYGDNWLYPCLGCGVEHNHALAQQLCPKPYSDPVGMENLLIEIRDLLVEVRDLLRSPSE